jgi:tetratricopeptide (TPR) repeat protein
MYKNVVCILFLAAMLGLSGCSRSMESLRTDGKRALERGDYVQAREYYLAALEQDNADKESLLGVAEAYQRDSRLDSTIYYLKRADIKYPDDRALNEKILEVARTLGDWTNAINAIETLVRTGDGYDKWYEQLSDYWLKKGEQGRAFYYGRRAIRNGTVNETLYLQCTEWAAEYDSLDAALEILDSAIARFGPLDRYVVNKAMLLNFAGKPRQAESLIRPIVERDNPPVPSMQLNLANILAAQPERAKKQEALSIYRQLQSSLIGRMPIDSIIQALSDQLK